MDLERYLDALASGDPVPGGGSAAPVVGALAAALCAMVARVTAASPRHAGARPEAERLAADADGARGRFLVMRGEDEQAYGAVVGAQSLPRESDPQRAFRRAQLQSTLAGAAAVPLRVAENAVETLALVHRAAELGNRHLSSDVTCALAFARAAFDASLANVEINHRFLDDAALVAEQRERLRALIAAARDHEARTRALVA